MNKKDLDLQDFPILEQFLGYFQAILERSPATIREYKYDLVLFFRYILQSRKLVSEDVQFEEIDLSTVDADLIRSIKLSELYGFVSWLNTERKCGPSARARRISALRTFFGYVKNKLNLIEENIALELESPKQLRRLPRHLSLDESQDLLAAAAASDSQWNERDYCILTFFLNCGMRLAELCSINLADIREDTLVVMGKGGKERTIYLNSACIAALRAYLDVRKPGKRPDEDALFISRLGRRISPKTVQNMIKKYIVAAGLDPRRYSTHKLRHTAATLMYQYGEVDIRSLQMILGHSSIATTEIYTHINNAALHRAVEQNPLNQVRRN